jgi:hypothetical protein
MVKRTDVIQSLKTALEVSTETPGFRGLKFLDEINDFPTFYVHAREETRTHIGGDVRYASISVDVRGYLFTDNLADTELYVRQLETGVQTFSEEECLVDEARTLSVKTDEGIMKPYSICDLKLQIIYTI